MPDDTISSLLHEGREFPPSKDFKANAVVRDPSVYMQAEDYEAFWEGWAKKLDWIEPWQKVLEWELPYAKWFVGGKINAAQNCVDRHDPNRRAIIFEGEPGDVRTFTYGELKTEVCKTANALRELGVKKGDIVCIYMPMVPELVIAMLACARVGAAHSVIFGGFSAEALRERINDARAVAVITADGGWRRGKVVELKKTVDEAVADTPSIDKVLVLKRIGDSAQFASGEWQNGRDVWWHDIVPRQSADCPCEPIDNEDLLYTLYTSGSTGKPKGIVHTTGGYLTGTLATFSWIFDYKPEDLYWCTADCGWVTGHSYVVYGPLAAGATIFIYEGAPDAPDKDRFWRLIEKHKINILYTAPTAIRAFMKWGDEYPERCDLSSLRLLGSVGEPINPEAWIWYWNTIGGGQCPIVDTWWQTETGQILISPLPGITTCKPGSATKPFPGIEAKIFDEQGREVVGAGGGYLVLTRPWPAMLRGIFNDPERYQEQYWSRFPGVYFTGDGVKRDEDGYLWLLGRVDDVMNVAGHRISTMEVESALVDHPAVAEAAVIGISHDIKGTGIAAFVLLRSQPLDLYNVATRDTLIGADAQVPISTDRLPAADDFAEGTHPQVSVEELREHVAKVIGSIAKPDKIFICADLPKTRSGKIMRRLLRDVAEGRALGDTTTLADPAIVASLKDQYEDRE
ncbi:MAG: acetate--CoA ligase [Armatimonadota bacterium]|nr:acetate--CoA ligase [Armatimonadota bacterium]